MIIQKLFLLALQGNASMQFLIVLILVGVIGGLLSALLIYRIDQYRVSNHVCTWCGDSHAFRLWCRNRQETLSGSEHSLRGGMQK